jgi:hypothetical protein
MKKIIYSVLCLFLTYCSYVYLYDRPTTQVCGIIQSKRDYPTRTSPIFYLNVLTKTNEIVSVQTDNSVYFAYKEKDYICINIPKTSFKNNVIIFLGLVWIAVVIIIILGWILLKYIKYLESKE